MPHETAKAEAGVVSFEKLTRTRWLVTARQDDLFAYGAADLSQDAQQTLDLYLGVSAALQGCVVDAAGQPVSGALLSTWEHDDGDVTGFFTSVSDEAGWFSFELLPTCLWTLRLQAEGYAPLETEPLMPGQPDIELVMHRASRVVGVAVHEETGLPVSNAAITFSPTQDPSRRVTASTNEEGRFRLDSMAEGLYEVTARHDRFAMIEFPMWTEVYTGDENDLTILMTNGGSISGQVREKISDAAAPGVTVNASGANRGVWSIYSGTSDESGHYGINGLPAGTFVVWAAPAAGILGRDGNAAPPKVTISEGGRVDGVDLLLVAETKISGIVVDGSGQAVSKGYVLADQRARGRRSVELDDDGHFVLDGIAPEQEVKLYAANSPQEIRPGQSFFVPAGGLEDVELMLEQIADCGVSGIVVDGNGAGVLATLWAVPGSTGTSGATSITDMEGNFLLEALRPETYKILVGPYPQSTPQLEVQSVTLKPGEILQGVRIVLDVGQTLAIAGRVVDPTGKPVANAHVACSLAEYTTRSNASGEFQFHGLQGEFHELSATAPGFGWGTLADVPQGTLNAEIQLPGAILISGRVVEDKTNHPVPQFDLELQTNQRSEGGFHSISNADGAFELSSGSAGMMRLAVKSPGYQMREVLLGRIEYGEDVSGIEIALKRSSTEFHGVVMDDNGRPVGGARIYLDRLYAREQKPRTGPVGTTDSRGEFALGSLPDERLVLTATHPAFAPGFCWLPPETGRSEAVTIVLEMPGSVSGVVVEGGALIEGATIMVFPVEDDTHQIVSTNTDASGSFEITGLASGDYLVRARERRRATPEDNPREAAQIATVSPGGDSRMYLELGPAPDEADGEMQ